MLKGVVHLPIHHFLVYVSIRMITFRAATNHWEPHHAIPQE